MPVAGMHVARRNYMRIAEDKEGQNSGREDGKKERI
jgi:hypothetical protein